MKSLVECVPNFSEGRDSGIVEAIAAGIAATDGVHLAGMEMDADHNRSVITFMGSPEDVAKGAYEACSIARNLIDLRRHRGVHPRIGATAIRGGYGQTSPVARPEAPLVEVTATWVRT